MVDWSRDVFPLMLRNQEKLIGFVANGYWTDIGSIEEYMRACSDYLMGKVQLPRKGHPVAGDVWIDRDVDIAPDAQLHGPIYLGQGVKIRSGAIIHGPTFIRDYAIVDARASVDRSFVWRNSYIGERAELRGAIILRQCDIRSRVVLFEGVVIGDNVQVGNGAVIKPNVRIWPGKEIDEGATVTNSIIWGSQARRVLFGRHGITGMVNIEITPEFCTRLGASYGATVPQGSTITINRDPHYTPRMLKRGIIAGLPSAGAHVSDLQSVPIPVARYYTHACGAAGGVHVRLDPNDSRMVQISFFDEHGLDLSTNNKRKIESIFFRGDYRRVYLDEIGRIAYGQRVAETYIEAFLGTIKRDALEHMIHLERSTHHPYLVVDYGGTDASGIFSRIMRQLHFNVVELNANFDEERVVQTKEEFDAAVEQLTRIVPVLGAHIGVKIDSSGERIVLIDDRGRRLSDIQALAAVAAMALRAHPGGTVAVPVTAPRVFEVLAKRYEGQILRTRVAISALMQAAMEQPDIQLLGDGTGNYIFPSFHPIVDGLFTIVKIIELMTLNETLLSTVVDHLPPFYMQQTLVPCRWEYKGKVMRILNEQYYDRRLDQVDGIKIDFGDEWVLILPDSDAPFFHVYAEAQSDDQARLLMDKYAHLISSLQ